MPMVNSFIPKKLRPWIYFLFCIIFQMSDGVYLGSQQYMVGELGWMREDVMFIFMCCVVGVAMPFPILFRLKFCYTNRQLETVAISGLIVTVALPLFTTWMPLLCLSSFLCGFFKLMATFECFSNIQLWITPKRDFQIFFPVIFMVILGDMSMAGWMSTQLSYFFGGWRAMHLFMVGALILILLYFRLCTHDFRFMRPIPFISIDWLGGVLWSLVLLTGVWIFDYAEYYNWTDSRLWTSVLCVWPVIIWAAFHRMYRINHPYLLPSLFRYRKIFPILFMFVVAEIMNGTGNSLEKPFWGAVLHYGQLTEAGFDLVAIAGNIVGCLFCLCWYKVWHMKYTRLLTVGFTLLVFYQVYMYFHIAPTIEIESLYLPTFVRNFGYTIFFVALTVYLEDLLDFRHFFMGLTVAGFVRNGLLGNIMSAIYAYQLRYYTADNMASGLPYTQLESMMMGTKQIFGILCYAGVFFLLLMMAYDVQPIRSTLRHIPYWNRVYKDVRDEMKREAEARKVRHAASSQGAEKTGKEGSGAGEKIDN
jgi:MFS transporter, DHA2 family, multidrug resistance protein